MSTTETSCYTPDYLMESEDEYFRVDVKTDSDSVKRQATWACLRPGMRVADLGCGPGTATAVLHELVQPGGVTVGADVSKARIEYARKQYGTGGLDFVCKDISQPLGELGQFDFVWMRFVLEYYRTNGMDILRNVSQIVKPGGTLCLIDLDHNCLTHFELPERLERTIFDFMATIEKRANFDAYAGRKLYSFLYDLGYEDIDISVTAHHLIYGKLGEVDAYNWATKARVASSKIGFQFSEYPGGFDEFLDEFNEFFSDPRRFTYTPLICARGRKPITR
jgi:ubiquinone/menaquinone biosynthesis C-methylase UbiE